MEKALRSTQALLNSVYRTFANVPLAKASRDQSQWWGRDGRGTTKKVRSVDTGRPLIGVISVINLPQAVFTVITLAEAERFNIILHFPITISHFVFSLSHQRQIGRVKGTQASESVRSTFASWLPHFWLCDPEQVPSTPWLPHCRRAADTTQASTCKCAQLHV